MPLPEDIVHFLQNHPDQAYCDDCLAEHFRVPYSEAKKAASALGAEDRVDRRLGPCENKHAVDRHVNKSV
jgi:hypothetical protein